MKLQGFIGPAYTLNSVNVDAQRAVNIYPEIIQSSTGKGGQVAYYKSTAGLDEIADVGAGPIRLVHYDQSGRCFVVSGNTLYKITYSAGWVVSASLGTFATSTGVIKAASSKFGTTDSRTLFVDGTSMHYYEYSGSDTFGLLTAFGFNAVDTATDITWVDGYFIVNEADTGTFHVSDLEFPNFDALSFASSEGDIDNIVGIIANRRDVWIFNERSTEVYVNTGNADFPFERIQGGLIETGCVSMGSIAKIKGAVFFLSRNEFGHGIVNIINGLTPQKISTHAIEQAISSYADISTSRAFTYQENGHNFYVLNFAEATWCYDIDTGLWHERAYTNAGTLERHRADTHAFFPSQGVHILGDYVNGKVFIYNDSTYTDNGDAITRLRTAPHMSLENIRLFCHRLWLDMETGVGLATGQGSDPQIMLDYSDDGGHTWSDESWTSAGGQTGGIGEYKTRVFWNRLGRFRDRIFRFKITDPVSVTFIGAYIEVEKAAH